MNKISTKELYLVEIKCIRETRYIGTKICHTYEDDIRYTLTKKVSNNKYKDIFTGKNYDYSESGYNQIGEEVVTAARLIVSSKNYITNEEYQCLLNECNSAFIHEYGPIKKLGKK